MNRFHTLARQVTLVSTGSGAFVSTVYVVNCIAVLGGAVFCEGCVQIYLIQHVSKTGNTGSYWSGCSCEHCVCGELHSCVGWGRFFFVKDASESI
jgi:hypothetical protein